MSAPSTRPAPPPPPATGRFLTGSTLGHVTSMTAAGSVGLLALFAVDVLNLFYIARMGRPELTAAAGYAATLLFFLTSLSIGLAIAATALTSRSLGAGQTAQAQQMAGASLAYMALSMALCALLMAPAVPWMLQALGAQGEAARAAERFLWIVLPSAPLLGLAMGLGALLRAAGDARRAMGVTLCGAAVVACLDPLFILTLGWGLDGAAVVTLLARLAMVAFGLQALVRRHRLWAWPSAATLRAHWRPYMAIGVPAVLTQLATPVGNAMVTAVMAPFGDAAVAAWAVIVRIIPMAFVALFALSGAVGPIMGQNLGAQRHDRLRSTLDDSLKLVVMYVLAVWLVLALGRGWIAQAFGATGQAAELIEFFCLFVAGSYLFNGALFVANAAFNNLGFAFYSTALNWGRATLGVAPFIALGGQWYGALGVLAGYGLGVVGFGVAGMWLCRRVIHRLEAQAS